MTSQDRVTELNRSAVLCWFKSFSSERKQWISPTKMWNFKGKVKELVGHAYYHAKAAFVLFFLYILRLVLRYNPGCGSTFPYCTVCPISLSLCLYTTPLSSVYLCLSVRVVHVCLVRPPVFFCFFPLLFLFLLRVSRWSNRQICSFSTGLWISHNRPQIPSSALLGSSTKRGRSGRNNN